MFNKKITDSDSFIELPSSAQVLYFHLNQGADDDGFNNQVQNAMFKSHATIDDLKVLMLKNFVIRFENGVLVIKHWRMHNTLRKDRYTPTNFQDELKQLGIKKDGSYTFLDDGCQVVAKRLPQDRLGKVSIGNTSSSINSINSIVSEATMLSENDDEEKNIFELVKQAFGRPLSPVEYEEINSWTDNDLTRHAIRIAELNRATKISYIVTILRNYERNGIRSTSEAEEFDRKFQERKNHSTVTSSKVPTKGFTPNEKVTFPNGLVGYYDEKGNIHYEE